MSLSQMCRKESRVPGEQKENQGRRVRKENQAPRDQRESREFREKEENQAPREQEENRDRPDVRVNVEKPGPRELPGRKVPKVLPDPWGPWESRGLWGRPDRRVIRRIIYLHPFPAKSFFCRKAQDFPLTMIYPI